MKTYFTGLTLMAALMFSAAGCENNVVDDDPNVPNTGIETDMEEDVDINTTTPPLDTGDSDDVDVNLDTDTDAGLGTDTDAGLDVDGADTTADPATANP